VTLCVFGAVYKYTYLLTYLLFVFLSQSRWLFSPTSVCLVTGLLKDADQIFIKFCGMVGHDAWTSRLEKFAVQILLIIPKLCAFFHADILPVDYLKNCHILLSQSRRLRCHRRFCVFFVCLLAGLRKKTVN